jgi:putative ABC transport system permease protein
MNSSIKAKVSEIGVLRSMGATKKSVIKIFVFESLIISAIIAIVSSILIVGFTFAVNAGITAGFRFNLSVLQVNVVSIVVSIVVCIITCFISSIFPLIGLSKQKLIQIIKNKE